MSERPLVDPFWAETVNRYWNPDNMPDDLLDLLPPEQASILRRRRRDASGRRESRKAIGESLGVSVNVAHRLESRAKAALLRLAYERDRPGRCPHCGGTGRLEEPAG